MRDRGLHNLLNRDLKEANLRDRELYTRRSLEDRLPEAQTTDLEELEDTKASECDFRVVHNRLDLREEKDRVMKTTTTGTADRIDQIETFREEAETVEDRQDRGTDREDRADPRDPKEVTKEEKICLATKEGEQIVSA